MLMVEMKKPPEWWLNLRWLLMLQVAISSLHLVYLDRIKSENLTVWLYPWIPLQLAFAFILNLAVTPMLALAEVHHQSPFYNPLNGGYCCGFLFNPRKLIISRLCSRSRSTSRSALNSFASISLSPSGVLFINITPSLNRDQSSPPETLAVTMDQK